MDKHPPTPRRRHALELAIRIVDLVVYAVVFGGGVHALIATPNTITESLEGYYGLILFWSALLCVGGLVGFVGRLSRYWLVEVPATIAAASGTLIYLVVLTQYLFASPAVIIIFMVSLVALAFMVRRWLELQIFATEPPGSPWRQRFLTALQRRTQNVANRS